MEELFLKNLTSDREQCPAMYPDPCGGFSCCILDLGHEGSHVDGDDNEFYWGSKAGETHDKISSR